MKILLFVLIFFLNMHCFGQAIIKAIREQNPDKSLNNSLKKTFIFPSVTIAKNKIASKSINDVLITDFLEIDRNKIKKSIFENIWALNENQVPRLNDINYKVLLNTKKLLSISISAEGCGAYCEYFTKYYTFDIKTGEKLNLSNILNNDGQKLLVDSLISKKKQRILSHLMIIQDTLNKESVQADKEKKLYYEEIQNLFENCFENNTFSNLNEVEFYIGKNKLFIYDGRCSAHANQALDELGEFEFIFETKQIQAYFTAEAYKLICK